MMREELCLRSLLALRCNKVERNCSHGYSKCPMDPCAFFHSANYMHINFDAKKIVEHVPGACIESKPRADIAELFKRTTT